MSEFFVPIEPMPAPRPRFSRNGHAYTEPKYAAFKEGMAEWITSNVSRIDYTTAPVSVTLEFVRTRPRTSKLAYPAGDLDNYAKGCLDAATQSQVVWLDDKQVIALTLSKKWGTPAGVRFDIRALD